MGLFQRIRVLKNEIEVLEIKLADEQSVSAYAYDDIQLLESENAHLESRIKSLQVKLEQSEEKNAENELFL